MTFVDGRIGRAPAGVPIAAAQAPSAQAPSAQARP